MTALSTALDSWAPGAAAELRRARELAAVVVDPRLVELARLRIATLLGHAGSRSTTPGAGLDEATVAELAQWPTSPRFGDADRACLGLAEQFVIDVSGVTDDDVRPVLAALGAPGLYGFVQALWVFDLTMRMELALGTVLGSEEPDSREIVTDGRQAG